MRRALILALLAATGCQAPAPVVPSGSPAPTPSAVATLSPATLTGAFLYYEDFEKGSDYWVVDGPSGSVGWRLLEAFACGGRYTMLLGQDAQAPFTAAPGTHTLTLSTPIDLTTAERPYLRYDLKGLAAPSSACVITPEVRVGTGEWRPVGTPVSAGLALANTFAADLTTFAGQTIALRFSAVLGATEQPFKGLYLDDVNVIEPTRP